MTRNHDEQQSDVKTIDDDRPTRGAYSPVWLAVPAGAVAACTLAADLPPVVTLALVLGAMAGPAILQALQVLQPILFNTAVHHQRRLDRRQIYRMRDASRRSAVFIHDERAFLETSNVVITMRCADSCPSSTLISVRQLPADPVRPRPSRRLAQVRHLISWGNVKAGSPLPWRHGH
jgi:hypothetical protein